MNLFLEELNDQQQSCLLPCKERQDIPIIDNDSVPFVVTLYNIEGLIAENEHIRMMIEKFDQPDFMNIRVSLFDSEFSLFFGKTWKSAEKKMKFQNKVNINKQLFFHSSINREKIMLIIELVFTWKNGFVARETLPTNNNKDNDNNNANTTNTAEDSAPKININNHKDTGKIFQIGCGWGAEKAFGSTICDEDFNERNKNSLQVNKMDLYPGTPRCLFYVKGDITDFRRRFTKSTGLKLNYSTQTHQNMLNVIHLIPENIMFSKDEGLPGIQVESGFKMPQLVPSLKCSIEKIEIQFRKGIEDFESSLRRLLLDDLIMDMPKTNKVISLEDVCINRRSLKIGSHNGRTFVGPLEEIQLSVSDDVINRSISKSSSFKVIGPVQKNLFSVASAVLHGSRSEVRKGRKSSVGSLVHGNKVEISHVMRDPSFRLVFCLVYEISIPRNNDNAGPNKVATDLVMTKSKLSSMAQPIMEVLVRWGALNASGQDYITPGNQDLQLIGGPKINPLGILSFSTHTPAFDDITMNKTDDDGVFDGGVDGGDGGTAAVETTLMVGSKRNDGGGFGRGSLSFVLHFTGEDEDIDYDFEQRRQQIEQEKQQHKLLQQQHLAEERERQKQKYLELQKIRSSASLAHEYEDEELLREVQRDKIDIEPTPPTLRTDQSDDEMRELSYVPHHVPIMAVVPGSKKPSAAGSSLSRAATAQLSSLGFPAILDIWGKPSFVLDPYNLNDVLVEREYEDSLKVNEVILQFMAFTSKPSVDDVTSQERPSSLIFTFQFYRFDVVTTERALLQAMDNQLTDNIWEVPFVIIRLDQDGSITKGPPGYQVKFVVDPSYMGHGKGQEYFKYLYNHHMHIDVWDGDTLFHIGSCLLELKCLLRQTRPSVQSTHELDVYQTEYIEPELMVQEAVVMAMISRDTLMRAVDVSTILRGKLHVRVANVGRKMGEVDGERMVAGGGVGRIRSEHHSQLTNLRGLHEGSKLHHLLKAKKSKAQRLPELSYELLQLMASRSSVMQVGGVRAMEGATSAEQSRKLERMEFIRKELVNNESDEHVSKLINSFVSFRSDTETRRRDLETIDHYRKNYKPTTIKDLLQKHITVDIKINVSLGSTTFFEFPLTNPYSTDLLVQIDWDDSELSIIREASEWRHFKLINNITTPVEEGMFAPITSSDNFNNENKEEPTNNINGHVVPNSVLKIFLRPKESVNIPFKYLTFKHMQDVHAVNDSLSFIRASLIQSYELESVKSAVDDGPDNGHKVALNMPNSNTEVNNRRKSLSVLDKSKGEISKRQKIQDSSSSRYIQVFFRCDKDLKIISALKLQVEQQPHIIDQTFRIIHPEQSFLKKSFRLPRRHLLEDRSTWNINGTSNQVYVRCSDPNVICHSAKVGSADDVDIFIKAACGPAPQLKIFFVALYFDPRLSQPMQIWRMEVKVMEKVDVAAIQGQTSRFALMLRGGLSSRLVRCYSSHPNQMSLAPNEPFMLLAGNLQQINVGVRPMKVGVSSMSINVVDAEAHQLVSGWLVHVITREPIISRHFEITLTIGGPGESKRISFTNPYGIRKTFLIRTNRSDLVRLKVLKLELDAGERSQINLKFLSAKKRDKVTILVFINDEDDKNEETFAVTVEYKFKQV